MFTTTMDNSQIENRSVMFQLQYQQTFHVTANDYMNYIFSIIGKKLANESYSNSLVDTIMVGCNMVGCNTNGWKAYSLVGVQS